MASSTCVHSQHFKVAPGFYFPPEILKLNFLCLFATFQHQPEKYHPHKEKSKSIMQGTTLQTWIFLSAVHMRSDYPQHQSPCGMVVPSFLQVSFLPGGKTRKVFYLIFEVLHCQSKLMLYCVHSVDTLSAGKQCFYDFLTIFQNMLYYISKYLFTIFQKFSYNIWKTAMHCLTVCTVSIFFLSANKRRGLTMFSQYYCDISKYFDNIYEILQCIVQLCAKHRYSFCRQTEGAVSQCFHNITTIFQKKNW